MKKLLAAAIVFVSVLASLLLIQRLQLSNYREGASGQQTEMEKIYDSQQPVHLTFKVVDQFGQPAANYSFLIRLNGIRWYYRYLPFLAPFHAARTLKTDSRGGASLRWWISKAYRFELDEVDRKKYLFQPPINPTSAKTISENAKYPFSMPILLDGKQEILLKVLKTDPPSHAIRYLPKFPVRPDGIDYKGTDEDQITLNLRDNKLDLGKTEGDILVTIRTAKSSGAAYWSHHRSGEPWDNKPDWEVQLDGLRGTVLQPSGDENIPYAPDAGYFPSVIHRIIFESLQPVGDPIPETKPIEWRDKVPLYVEDNFEGLTKTYLVKTERPTRYWRIKIIIDISPDGTVSFRPLGHCNADGGKNL